MKTKKELTELINDYMTDEQTDFVYKLINVFCSNHLSKGDLLTFTGMNKGTIDSAMPHDYITRVKEIYPNFNTNFHCFDYRTKSFGELTNVAEEAIRFINENLNESKQSYLK